jgi:arylsulfatase A-like enzyme
MIRNKFTNSSPSSNAGMRRSDTLLKNASRFLLIGVTCWLLSPTTNLIAEEGRPNVVIILADDMGAGDLGCYGHPKFKTPRIDQMAAEGVRLTQFNTPLPYCAPTRASLLTGRYPFRCGMSQNPAPDGGPAADALALPESEITLAEILRRAGYATGIVGKWHLGHKPGKMPTDRGFGEYFGIPYSNDMRPVQLYEGTKVVEYPVVQTILMDKYDSRAETFIRKHQTQPFFLYFAHSMPHKPLAPSERNYKKSGAGLYGDVMADLDASVGRLLDTLRDCNIDQKTLVLFTSDNGAWFGGSTGGLRGMKGRTFEGGLRVPMIARWPARIQAGRVNHQPAVMMDLFATVLKATGTSLPDSRTIDGLDIMPLLLGDAPTPHEFIFAQKDTILATVRDTKWKLHVIPSGSMQVKREADGKWRDPRGPDGITIIAPFEQYGPDDLPGAPEGDQPHALQLFDLEKDPAEQHNVAAIYPKEVARLKAAFDAMASQIEPVEKIKRAPLK